MFGGYDCSSLLLLGKRFSGSEIFAVNHIIILHIFILGSFLLH